MPVHSICTSCLQAVPDIRAHAQRCSGRAAQRQKANEKQRDNGTKRRHWMGVVQSAKQLAGWSCQRCGRHKDDLRKNERLTGHLRPELQGNHDAATVQDVTVLCSTCHGAEDGGRSRGGRGASPGAGSSRPGARRSARGGSRGVYGIHIAGAGPRGAA